MLMGRWSVISFFFLLSLEALATSTVPETAQSLRLKNLRPRCEAQARFVAPIHRDLQVFWKFEIQKSQTKNRGSCPTLTAPSLITEVLIPSAEYVQKINTYVYPGYLVQPLPEKTYLIQIEKNAEQAWIFSDWKEGIKPSP